MKITFRLLEVCLLEWQQAFNNDQGIFLMANKIIIAIDNQVTICDFHDFGLNFFQFLYF